MRVLIVGAGYVGCALGLQLVEEGHQVFALRRRIAQLPSGLQGVQADLMLPKTLENLPRELAAVVYTTSPDESTDAAYERAYGIGVRHLLGALEAQGLSPRRVVFTSSTAVYSQRGGEWVDETSPAESTHFTGARVREGEQLVLARGGAIVLRLGGIYGPGRTRLIEAVKSGTASFPEGAPQYVNRNHRDDCAAALAHLLTLQHPCSVYLGTDGNPADQRTAVEWLAAQLGAPPPRAAPRKTNSHRAHTNKRCRNERLRATGFRFAYPSFREGYGALMKG